MRGYESGGVFVEFLVAFMVMASALCGGFMLLHKFFLHHQIAFESARHALASLHKNTPPRPLVHGTRVWVKEDLHWLRTEGTLLSANRKVQLRK
jgi:hypothetical protein